MAQEARAKALSGIAADLQTDCLIHICVGKGTAQVIFSISAALLRNTSPRLGRIVADLLFGASLGTPAAGEWILEQDSADAWKVLLHWKLRGYLPATRDIYTDGDIEGPFQRLVDCWLLGDKHAILDFQDLIMLELLNVLRRFEPSRDTDTLVRMSKLVFEQTKPESPLFEVMVEEVAAVFAYGGGYGGNLVEDMDTWVGAGAFTVPVLRLLVVGGPGSPGTSRFEGGDWVRYMVGGGPKKHWVFGEDEKSRNEMGKERWEEMRKLWDGYRK